MVVGAVLIAVVAGATIFATTREGSPPVADTASSLGGPSVVRSSTTRANQVAAATVPLAAGAGHTSEKRKEPPPPPSKEAVETARVAVKAIAPKLPYSKPVVDCLTNSVAKDEDLLGQVRDSAGDRKVKTPVVNAGAACVTAVESAPRFAEKLQTTSKNRLTHQQVNCARDGYAHLRPGQIQAAAGAILNPAVAKSTSLDPIRKIMRSCNIPVPGK